MRFALVDQILATSPHGISAIKAVTNAEEYLQDHFPTFPVLPGVIMLEAIVQTAREWAIRNHPNNNPHHAARLVLASARAVKYANFLRPGETLRIDINNPEWTDNPETLAFKATAIPIRQSADPNPQQPTPQPCVSGRFTLRHIKLAPPPDPR